MEKQTMGSFIAALRRAAGMTQRELAERLNVSDKAVSRWERDESAPDLSLLPVIADLFGITIDELVRGRRSAGFKREETVQSEDAVRSDERVRRGIQTIAGRELAKLCNRSLIAAGIDAAGLVVVLLCNYCFTAANLGFFLSLLFYGAAALLETVFIRNYFTSIGGRMTAVHGASEDTRIDTYLSSYREQGSKSALMVYAFSVGLLSATLPFAFAPSYTGLILSVLQLFECLLWGAVGASLIVLLYHFVFRPILTQKGILPKAPAPTERDIARRRIRKQYALVLAILLTMTGIGTGIFHNIPVSNYAQAVVFEDFDSFRAFMEQSTGESNVVITDDSSQMIQIPDGEVDLSDRQDWETDTITDADGNVLCQYVWRNETVASVSYPESGLPIRVCTFQAMQAAYEFQKTVDSGFAILAVMEVAVCWLLCRRRSQKV